MAKSRSDTNLYPSRYSPNVDENGYAWVTGRQYIVELICENKALRDSYNNGESKELPRGFYTKELSLIEWQKFYTEQINNRSLTKLINTHTVDKIIAFLRDNRFIISLRPKWVHEKLDKYNYIPKTKPTNDYLSYKFTKPESFSTNNKKKSIISKLEDLE
jgi:hypothetical protein